MKDLSPRILRRILYATVLLLILLSRRIFGLFGMQIDASATTVFTVAPVLVAISLLFLESAGKSHIAQSVTNMRRMVYCVMAAVEAYLIWSLADAGDILPFALGNGLLLASAVVFQRESHRIATSS